MDNHESVTEREAPAAVPQAEERAPETAEQTPEEAMREFVRADAREFRRQYPQVDLRELDADPLFRLFCGSRYGREPLADLYGDYLALREQASEEAARRRESRRERATGSGGSGGYEALTAAEQQELNEWNRAYPHMKMTAKEYKSR